MYVLTFYLMMSSKEEIDNTFFFFAQTIPESLRKHFPNSAYLRVKESPIYRHKLLLAPYMLIKRWLKWPFLFSAEIYGLDFYWFLLRGLKINYLEDAPSVFDIWEGSSLYQNYVNATKASPIKKWIRRVLYGEYYCFPVGTSTSAKAIYATSPSDKPYHRGKAHYVINFKDEWEKSSPAKKQFIRQVFEITDADVALLNSRSVILLTQPLCVDKIMTEEEQISIYRSMIAHYGAENVLIKPHPRDKIRYTELFPGVAYFTKSVPMQLLALWGANFKKVATVNSSSAFSFGEDADIDWWAEKLDYERITDGGVKTLAEAKKLLHANK
jgi:hypothetical protein